MANEKVTKWHVRSDFQSVLNTGNVRQMERAFHIFCCLEPSAAQKCLWNLTYDKVAAEGALTALMLDVHNISEDDIEVLRNELHFHYERVRKFKFSKLLPFPRCCVRACKALAKQARAIATNEVMQKCLIIGYSTHTFRTEVLDLLNSEEEYCQIRGLSNLGFNKEECEYLKRYHTYIASLFEAWWDYCRNQVYTLEELDKLSAEAWKRVCSALQ